LHPLLRPDCRQKLINSSHRHAQVALKPAVIVECQGARANRKNVTLVHTRLRDFDTPARRLHLTKTHRPGLGRKIIQAAK
jgi:hypothetical protein